MKKRILYFVLIIIGSVAAVFGVAACNDQENKTAYELYKENYIEINGSEEGILSEEEWLLSHNPDHEHKWSEGVITTKPTCITPGVITYTCGECNDVKKEPLDANGEHVWGEYDYDDECHWRSCRLCGEFEKHEHDFGGASKDSGVDELLECECGINKTVGEFYSYKVTFDCGDGVSIIVYDTQKYENGGTSATVAYARNSETGELLNNGDGQVNFEVVVAVGYKLIGVSATPMGNFKNLKGSDETDRDNTYRLTKITGEVTITVETEIDFLDLPVMVINTKNGAPILDKENYVTCNVSVLNAEDKYCFEDSSGKIRGRGNYTWTEDKKPYKLKFDFDTDLFGNGEARIWTLIANHYDMSLIRNYLTFKIGSDFVSLSGTTTSAQFVDLYLNGEYIGVYLICEQNEVGSNRVDIEDDFSVAVTPEQMGFLLELDGRAASEGVENLDYITVNGQYYAISSPDYEDIKDGQNIDYNDYVLFIKNYLQNICDMLNNNEDYIKIQEYIDVDSFADSYIVNELVKSGDIGQLSFYIYRNNVDGKLYCGPIWDYDVAIGNCTWADCKYYDVLYAKRENFYYRTLLEYQEFKDLVSKRLSDKYSAVKKIINTEIDYVLDNYSQSFLRNFERWEILINGVNAPHTEEIAAIKTWEGQVAYVKEWLLNSLEYLMSEYC